MHLFFGCRPGPAAGDRVGGRAVQGLVAGLAALDRAGGIMEAGRRGRASLR